MTELKPCPFCACIDTTVSTSICDDLRWHYAECIECGARSVDCNIEAEAIAAWNTRPGDEALAHKVLEAAAGKLERSGTVYNFTEFEKAAAICRALNPAEILETK